MAYKLFRVGWILLCNEELLKGSEYWYLVYALK